MPLLKNKPLVNSRLANMLVVAFLLSCLAGCEQLAYYQQAASGQLGILWQREDIVDVLAKSQQVQADEYGLDADKAQKLAAIESYRQFAIDELALPGDDVYQEYVALKQDYVLWNVFAAPEFELKAKTWCFPIAGCIAYRGYFAQAGANKKAEQLKQDGFDVYVGGVEAYSTLGWFDDPVLSSFLRRDEHQLAALIFHEIAHKQLYLAGDTKFSESFASAVEAEGLRRWLLAQGKMDLYSQYQQRQLAWQKVLEFLLDRREQLKAVYSNAELTLEQRREQKQQLLDNIGPDFAQAQPQLYPIYQRWLARPFNNARLLTLASYQDWVPAFSELLKQQGNDLPKFYQAAEELSLLPNAKRLAQLNTLLAKAGKAQ